LFYSVTITWDVSPGGADSYEIRVIVVETNEVFMTFSEIFFNTFTVTNLSPLVNYRVEVQ